MKFKLALKPLLLMGLLLLAGISEATTDRYRIMWRDDPATTMVIGWNQVSGSNATVHYGTSDFGTNWSSYPNTRTVDKSVSFAGMNNKFVRLTGLQPNTAYYFVIRNSQATSSRFWFKTAPNVNTERLSFIAGGDSRNDRTPRVNANKLVAKLRPHAVLFGGDYTNSSTPTEWNDWFDDWQNTIGSDGRMIPIVGTRGNHENNDYLVNLFDVPSSDVYYALTFGGNLIRTYTLNTEITISGDQAYWLASDLAASDDVIWKTAQYHKGMRPHTTGKGEGSCQYDHWAPLFEQYKVQLVIECDAHTVKTTWPIVPSFGAGSDEGFIRDDCSGTVYAGEGCWGAPLRQNNDDKSWTRDSGKFNQFKWIFVDQEKIEMRTIKVDNADAVGQISDNDIFTAPANLDIWNPDNGSLVTIGEIVEDIVHTGTINSDYYAASNSIISTATIGNNQDVTYTAGNFICLNDVFLADADNGVTFLAYVDIDCLVTDDNGTSSNIPLPDPETFVDIDCIVTDDDGGSSSDEDNTPPPDPKTDESDAKVTFKNYPNPFTGQTTIEFTLLKDTPVTLSVSDATGREVEVLLDNEVKAEGTHLTNFDGNNYPAGMYYYTIQAGEYVGTQKMVLMK